MAWLSGHAFFLFVLFVVLGAFTACSPDAGGSSGGGSSASQGELTEKDAEVLAQCNVILVHLIAGDVENPTSMAFDMMLNALVYEDTVLKTGDALNGTIVNGTGTSSPDGSSVTDITFILPDKTSHQVIMTLEADADYMDVSIDGTEYRIEDLED